MSSGRHQDRGFASRVTLGLPGANPAAIRARNVEAEPMSGVPLDQRQDAEATKILREWNTGMVANAIHDGKVIARMVSPEDPVVEHINEYAKGTFVNYFGVGRPMPAEYKEASILKFQQQDGLGEDLQPQDAEKVMLWDCTNHRAQVGLLQDCLLNPGSTSKRHHYHFADYVNCSHTHANPWGCSVCHIEAFYPQVTYHILAEVFLGEVYNCGYSNFPLRELPTTTTKRNWWGWGRLEVTPVHYDSATMNMLTYSSSTRMKTNIDGCIWPFRDINSGSSPMTGNAYCVYESSQVKPRYFVKLTHY